MKNLTLTALSVILAISVSSCATAPDPEKICTAEWIEKRSDKALDKIQSKAGKSIKSLSKAAESWSQGKKPGLFQMLALQNSFKSLEKELKSGQGMKDLRTLASTCDDPELVSKSMSRFLRKQKLPENMINFIENFAPYQRLITPESETLKTAQLLTK